VVVAGGIPMIMQFRAAIIIPNSVYRHIMG
jgi:hypothetical protein